MLNMSVSIYELHDASQAVRVNLSTGEAAKVYSKYGLGLPLFMVPFLLANDALHNVFSAVNSQFIISTPNLVIMGLIAEVVFLTLTGLGYGFARALPLSIASVFGTAVYPYMNVFLSEPLQGLAITASFLFLLRGRSSRSAKTASFHMALGAIAFCFLVLTKAANLVFLPLLCVYVMISVRDKAGGIKIFASFAVPVAAFGMGVAWFNWHRFGSIFDFGYGGEAAMFVNPVLAGIYNFLFNPDKSILLFAPAILLLPYALWRFAKRFFIEGVLISSLILVNLVFYSAWWAWEGGDSWGPRFLLPLVPLSIVPLAEVMGKRLMNLAAALLFATGFLVNLIGVVQDPAGYNYIVLKSTAGMDVATGRPKRDYDTEQAPPYVVTSNISEFNVLSGHLWLLKARFEGWRTGLGLGAGNLAMQSPPWIDKYPENQPPPYGSLPEEIRIRIECPPPLFLSLISCPGKSPSVPYYYDALTLQSEKAEALGDIKAASRLREKAAGEAHEKRKRLMQMRL